jgi:hypothetical protein
MAQALTYTQIGTVRKNSSSQAYVCSGENFEVNQVIVYGQKTLICDHSGIARRHGIFIDRHVPVVRGEDQRDKVVLNFSEPLLLSIWKDLYEARCIRCVEHSSA